MISDIIVLICIVLSWEGLKVVVKGFFYVLKKLILGFFATINEIEAQERELHRRMGK